MRNTTVTCDRCGSVIAHGGTVLDVQAGTLRARLHQPVDLCGDCGSLLLDWLRGARQTPQDGLNGPLQATAVASMALEASGG